MNKSILRCVLMLPICLLCEHVVTAQDSKTAQAFAGCYELKVEGWRSFILDSPPRRLQLTTQPVESGFKARDLDTKERWDLMSAWNVTDEGKVEISWSTGLAGWNIQLSGSSGINLRGTAEYFTDTNPHSGVVTVVAHPVDCKVLASRRSQLIWLLSPRAPWPLLLILAILFFALLSAAIRRKNKLLSQ